MRLPGLRRLDHVGFTVPDPLAPWGMQFELVSYPHGRAFFRNEGR